MNKEHWTKYYRGRTTQEPSEFAKWCSNYLRGDIVELGCGNCRDLKYFHNLGLNIKGIDQIEQDLPDYVAMDVGEYISIMPSPDTVYTRFFWHAIERHLQLQILDWVKDLILIEARTTEDKKLPKLFTNHTRNYVNVPQLVKDLKMKGFQIIRLEEGTGFSKYNNEDPHLVRVIAKKI